MHSALVISIIPPCGWDTWEALCLHNWIYNCMQLNYDTGEDGIQG